jgi:hypothetical protein
MVVVWTFRAAARAVWGRTNLVRVIGAVARGGGAIFLGKRIGNMVIGRSIIVRRKLIIAFM